MLSGGRFDKASFRDAELEGAILAGASFDGADFKGARLDHTILAGADLSRANGLEQVQLDDACADGHTRVPAKLTAKLCAARMLVHTPPPLPPAPPIPGAPRYLVWGW